uniref:Transposase MuDR plant domain-containing protein n=1 Tax=Fagus sylvatica TaxID=28930 RepID=A0A2N9J8Y1_FAGSY
MVTECGLPSTSLVYYLIIGEGGVEPLQVVGQSDFGGVVDEGDEVEGDWMSTGDELEGDELNEGDEGADFADDIFGGNEAEVGDNGGNNASDAQPSMHAEVGSSGGNNASDAQPLMQPEVGSNGGNNAQPGVGSNEGNNAQAKYAPSITRPNQPDVQEPDWTEPGIKDYEIHTGAISDDEDPRDGAPEFNQQTGMRKPDLVLGMKFPNSRVFREALREYVVNKAVDIKFKLNEKTKISVYCKNDCGWRLYASVVPGELTFQIKTFQSVCTCGKSFQHIELSRNQVYRDKRKAREMLEGDEKLQYAALWDYAAMIRKTNVGSKVYIKCDCSEDGGQPRFLRMYVRYHAQKVGFLASCRPIIGLDGCHLKGRFGGQLLATTARDGNDNIFLVAVAVVEQECKESWIWFLKHFSEDIGDLQDLNLVFISDRQKGLVPAFKKLFPKVEHRVRLMTRLHTKRIGMEKYGGSVCPNVQDKLEKLKMESRSFSAMPSSRIWDLTGIPCKHGVAVIYKNIEHPEDYLHNCYLKEAYLDVYSEIIHPMPGQDEGVTSGVKDSGSGVGRGKGATSGAGCGVGMGSTSDAGMGSTSGQASGVGKGSISGQASCASRSWTNGAAVKNLGEKRTKGSGSSRLPKLPVVGEKGK